MSYLLRAFNEQGISEFRSLLGAVRSGSESGTPRTLCFDDRLSQTLTPEMDIEDRTFISKLDAARYLSPKVEKIRGALYDSGLWSWLSAFYFDTTCPLKGGSREPGADYRHILQPGRNWRHYYRHLLAGPVRTYDFHRENARLLLSGPVDKMGDYVEQLCSRQEIAANRSLIEAASSLYWDIKTEKPKRGAAPNSRKPGTLRRFVDVIQQFEMTYDLYSMTCKEILALLPDEFDAWHEPVTQPQ